MWWWKPSWILPCWTIKTAILDLFHSATNGSHLKTNSICQSLHSHLTWWCHPSWILPSWIQPFWTIKNFTHSFSLNLMMEAILNSTILDSAILHIKKLHSFIVTQLDDGSHLELCHVGFSHCHLGFKHLVIFSQNHSKHSHPNLTQNQTNSIWFIWWWQPSWILPSWFQPFFTKLWLTLIQSDSNSFILTQLDDDSHLEICHLGFNHFEQKKTSLFHSHSTWWWQPSWILPSWIQPFCTKKNFIHSFWLILMMAAILNSAILDWTRHCHLGFRHLVFFSQIHSKTLSLHSDSDSN